ncbi:hypothetical protein F5141DRAFT_1059511 [Pisolithus sp. B1]|nr:hypothetical protein F5141DRAFT_1059511 [Pisolithus sp. B1]
MAPRVETYTHASDISDAVIAAFESNEGAANIMYPFILKAKDLPRDSAQLWIAYFEDNEQVAFVLSCTRGVLGNYPVFIFTTKPPAERKPSHTTQPLELLAHALRASVPPERVFAVFSCEDITREFGRIWADLTHIAIGSEYYRATFSYCTAATFTLSSALRPLPEDRDLTIWLGPAKESHTAKVAELCQKFAATSEPYVLTSEDALLEAKTLISKKEVWVHMIQEGDEGESDIASIVAVTRQSGRVAAITKVFTNPRWRALGCAERLLRRVCKDLLVEKDRIVLYVGVENNAARVYHRVGFQGLAGGGEVAGVETWLELGFDRQCVELGFW